ncbi:hypothetical protein [Clostridium thermopalmarium]|uniref:Uncharacterized protein n=1 Tax=Clostridium thermopalmarium DSM 5974 TaxID=1121340 RepID=A0A2T0AMP1_9CLOT|nr:hypothetical protein [Clostridium thermopalmarium]PRR70138.1 hypothetical protein CPAL_23590 [Clostridium thermopalmarium DSM 5974]PVZ23153.1 hypothetical protein LX19_01652 [Clostridium thermopalmarium DSM 5974]
MILNKLRSKKGATFIIVAIMMVILFPVIMSGIIDLNNIHKTSKRLKISLNAAVKSASSRIDWQQVPNGTLQIDVPKANGVFRDIFSENFRVTPKQVNNYYEAVDTNSGNKVSFYSTIYNNRHKGSFINFPGAGTIPSQVTNRNITVPVDRPTVVGVATVKYKLTPLLGGGTINITQFASSELNDIPQNKQKSATYPNP